MDSESAKTSSMVGYGSAGSSRLCQTYGVVEQFFGFGWPAGVPCAYGVLARGHGGQIQPHHHPARHRVRGMLALTPNRDQNSTARAVRRAAHTVGMPVRLHHIVVDAHDLPGLARFWTQVLGWKVLSERENEIVIGTDENAPVGMCFMPVADPKTVKNRVHLDLTSSAEDRDQEIDRLLALGARRVNIGQTGAESWTVLADPEGNEFCVVRPKETLIR